MIHRYKKIGLGIFLFFWVAQLSAAFEDRNEALAQEAIEGAQAIDVIRSLAIKDPNKAYNQAFQRLNDMEALEKEIEQATKAITSPSPAPTKEQNEQEANVPKVGTDQTPPLEQKEVVSTKEAQEVKETETPSTSLPKDSDLPTKDDSASIKTPVEGEVKTPEVLPKTTEDKDGEEQPVKTPAEDDEEEKVPDTSQPKTTENEDDEEEEEKAPEVSQPKTTEAEPAVVPLPPITSPESGNTGIVPPLKDGSLPVSQTPTETSKTPSSPQTGTVAKGQEDDDNTAAIIAGILAVGVGGAAAAYLINELTKKKKNLEPVSDVLKTALAQKMISDLQAKQIKPMLENAVKEGLFEIEYEKIPAQGKEEVDAKLVDAPLEPGKEGKEGTFEVKYNIPEEEKSKKVDVKVAGVSIEDDEKMIPDWLFASEENKAGTKVEATVEAKDPKQALAEQLATQAMDKSTEEDRQRRAKEIAELEGKLAKEKSAQGTIPTPPPLPSSSGKKGTTPQSTPQPSIVEDAAPPYEQIAKREKDLRDKLKLEQEKPEGDQDKDKIDEINKRLKIEDLKARIVFEQTMGERSDKDRIDNAQKEIERLEKELEEAAERVKKSTEALKGASQNTPNTQQLETPAPSEGTKEGGVIPLETQEVQTTTYAKKSRIAQKIPAIEQVKGDNRYRIGYNTPKGGYSIAFLDEAVGKELEKNESFANEVLEGLKKGTYEPSVGNIKDNVTKKQVIKVPEKEQKLYRGGAPVKISVSGKN